jgi:hypothetical protein
MNTMNYSISQVIPWIKIQKELENAALGEIWHQMFSVTNTDFLPSLSDIQDNIQGAVGLATSRILEDTIWLMTKSSF